MGRDVSMAWLSDSYDEIVDSLGEAGSNAGGGGFARLASTIIGKFIHFFSLPFDMTKKPLKLNLMDVRGVLHPSLLF